MPNHASIIGSRRDKNGACVVWLSSLWSIELKKCECCGKEFQQTYQPKLYCSRKCAIKKNKVFVVIGKEKRKSLRKQGVWLSEKQVRLGDLVDGNF